MNARIFSPVSSEGTGTLTCGRLKMEIKWLQTSTHTHTHTHTHKTHLLKRTRDYSVLPPRSSPEAARAGVIVQSNRNQQNMRNNRMYIDVPECKSVDVNVFLSQLLFHINIHIYMNQYCTVYEMEQKRMLNVNIQTCNTFIRQHVHVDVHYFNTLILLERGNPEAYHLCCPCK